MGDFAYYLGSTTGKVYKFEGAQKADDTTAIACQWVSKRIRPADQLQQLQDRWTGLYNIKLTYQDKGSVSVTPSVSTDGGVNYTDLTAETVGSNSSGDDVIKTNDFHTIITGQYFNIKLVYSATTKDIVWTELELEVEDSGEHFSLS